MTLYYLGPNQLMKIDLPQEELQRKFGCAAVCTVNTPGARLAGREIGVIKNEHLFRNLERCGSLGDTNRATIEWLNANFSVQREVTQVELPSKRRPWDFIIRQKSYVTVPPSVNFRFDSYGDWPTGGLLTEAAQRLPKLEQTIDTSIDAVVEYFEEANARPILEQNHSVGGTEGVNLFMLFKLKRALKTIFDIRTWILGEHSQLKSLTAHRISAGTPKNSLVFLRFNEPTFNGNLRIGDYAYARAKADILGCLGQGGQWDVTTILNKLREEGNGICTVDAEEAPIKIREVTSGIEIFRSIMILKRKEQIQPDSEATLNTVNRAFSALASREPLHSRGLYMVHGPFEEDEVYEIKNNSRAFTKRPTIVLPTHVPIKKRGDRYVALAYVLFIHTGKSNIPLLDEIFDLHDSTRVVETVEAAIPRDIGEKAIDSTPWVSEGLEMIAGRLGVDAKGLLRGESS